MKKKVGGKYLESEINAITNEDLDRAAENSADINRKMSTAGALRKYAEIGKTMLDMLNDFRKGDYRQVPWLIIASIGFALLYVFNPLDLVPDFLPGIGYLDDLTVFSFVLRFIETDLHKYLDWKLEQNELQTE